MDRKLNEFGEILINEVRDTTICSMDKMLDGRMKGITAKLIQDKISILSSEQIEIVKWLIPKIVDLSLHNLLFMIEEHSEIEFYYQEESLKELSDGLAGELYTEDGWIQKHSKERYDEI